MKDYIKIYKKYYNLDWDGSEFEVHHLDNNRENNDISNLILLPKKLHQKYHRVLMKLDYIGYSKIDCMNFNRAELLIELAEILEEINIWVDKQINRKLEIEYNIKL